MKNGFDASADLTNFITCLEKSNYDFVARYYNIIDQSKNLSLAEALHLSRAGIGIVAVWENGYPIKASYFTYETGVHDGTNAYHIASQVIGQPGGTPVYFAVDYDADSTDLDNILQYFKGIQVGFNAVSKNNPLYMIGVYGSGLVCNFMLSSKIATYSWLAQSIGWQDYHTFSNYNIKQSSGTTTQCLEGVNGGGDDNESPNDQEGAFSVLIA
jgi:hypothetical protein